MFGPRKFAWSKITYCDMLQIGHVHGTDCMPFFRQAVSVHSHMLRLIPLGSSINNFDPLPTAAYKLTTV